MREDGRENSQIRKVKITPSFIKHAEGSVLFELGETKVICTASLEEKVPPFLKNTGTGWITAEYGMLPRSTTTRIVRESHRGLSGRTHEIQRLIGRSLRAVANLETLGERTIRIDCDVIQADGGTRTASITGSMIALYQICNFLKKKNMLNKEIIKEPIAAISIGIINGEELLDLTYKEDFQADVDSNLVMTQSGEIIEIQGTAEKKPFSKKQLNKLISLGEKGIQELILMQKEILKIN